ncbi:hypothetical protein C2857_006739 [Epichloe festucae Fl1]|uniref:Alpha-L-arabinofuranosidase n=1 Tax=Epichloe festucae (strain Fl1) TaxID=877507 RepID=A0A7S9PW15_EPIFF|nr:hypothetical protein C2857_006739 [Epichloe festucae Fl1]
MKFLSLAWVVAAAAASAGSSSSVAPRASIPNKFSWTSTGPLISAKSDGRGIRGIKDPSVVHYGGKYHVFASTVQDAGSSLVYLSFTDWAQAQHATFHYLDGKGRGYRAAPQVLYMASQQLWYLIYHDGLAAYSTNPDISDPAGWTAPKHFYNSVPASVKKTLGDGAWVDMWVICDDANCHLFSTGDDGYLYRAQTSITDFPRGMGEPVVALKDSKFALFEASNVYNIGGSYLLIVEAAGSFDGYRYFRSWTSESLSGQWKTLASTEQNPFAGHTNVKFSGAAWTMSFSHGEAVRTNVDQTMTIKPCGIEYLYQGVDPREHGDYNNAAWKLALLTQVGGCGSN